MYIYIYIYIYIALWCKNETEHSIWDESLLLSNCARSLEYSSSSTLAGLSYHICGKLEVTFIASPSSQHQHCTDEAQKAETVRASDVLVALFFQIEMPMEDEFPKSVVLHFPPSVYQRTGASAMLPKLLQILNAEDLRCVQFLRGGKGPCLVP